MFTYEDLHKLIDEDCLGRGHLIDYAGNTCVVGQMFIMAGIRRESLHKTVVFTKKDIDIFLASWPFMAICRAVRLAKENDAHSEIAERRKALHGLVKTFEKEDLNGL